MPVSTGRKSSLYVNVTVEMTRDRKKATKEESDILYSNLTRDDLTDESLATVDRLRPPHVSDQFSKISKVSNHHSISNKVQMVTILTYFRQTHLVDGTFSA